jgi:hypothetical protein
MTAPSRFTIVGDWKFVGEGKVIDNSTGNEVNAKLRFKAATPTIETNPENREDVKTNLTLVSDENNTMWEMVILDQE